MSRVPTATGNLCELCADGYEEISRKCGERSRRGNISIARVTSVRFLAVCVGTLRYIARSHYVRCCVDTVRFDLRVLSESIECSSLKNNYRERQRVKYVDMLNPKDFTGVELKEALRELNCSTSGTKKDLILRLTTADPTGA